MNGILEEKEENKERMEESPEHGLLAAFVKIRGRIRDI